MIQWFQMGPQGRMGPFKDDLLLALFGSTQGPDFQGYSKSFTQHRGRCKLHFKGHQNLMAQNKSHTLYSTYFIKSCNDAIGKSNISKVEKNVSCFFNESCLALPKPSDPHHVTTFCILNLNSNVFLMFVAESQLNNSSPCKILSLLP